MRRSLLLVTIASSIAACRLFVDLDGLGDGSGADAGQGDALTPDAPIDTGSSSSSSGSGGLPDAQPDVVFADSDASAPCPGTGGPTAIRIPTASGSFCIDSTEVTRAQYNDFLTAAVSPATQGASCAWNTSFTPKSNWPAALDTPSLPIGAVNWCDADAFCKWAGKRLCGRVGVGAVDGGTGGAPMSAAEYANNTVNEFAFACSHAGTRVYPYGDVFDSQKCNGGSTKEPDTIEPVKFRPACESGYGGVYDLAGNNHEWANGCVVVGADPKLDTCAVQNSAYTHADSEMTCTSWFGWERVNNDPEVGFRCCSD